MVEVEIRELQKELNRLIDQGTNLAELYELSVRLDSLIVKFYSEKKFSEKSEDNDY